MKAIASAGFGDQDQLSQHLMVRVLEQRIADFNLKELGPKFDIGKFHDEILDGGSLPLDLLDARTDKWSALQKTK